jgi:hypothetical protein
MNFCWRSRARGAASAVLLEPGAETHTTHYRSQNQHRRSHRRRCCWQNVCRARACARACVCVPRRGVYRLQSTCGALRAAAKPQPATLW